MTTKAGNPKRAPVNVVAIVPARAGNQSIPYKNLYELGGKTLLAWSVESALKAELVDLVVVSTEDERIELEAKKTGALVVKRPPEYSTETSGDAGFHVHTVKWLESEFGWTPEFIVNLRPTSPLRSPQDIDRMIRYIQESDVDGLRSIIPSPLHPYKMWTLDAESVEPGSSGKIDLIFDYPYRRKHGPDQPRQEIQKKFPIFLQDGQIDITRRKFVIAPECIENDNVWGENLHGFVLDPATSVDLDEPKDFERAHKIYRDRE